MRAMLLNRVGTPLELQEIPLPVIGEYEVLVRVEACGVCRTDLHIIEGELPHPKLPLILGHQVVGVIEKIGSKVSRRRVGDRVGIPWLGGSCGSCEFCLSEKENLCDYGTYTGYSRDGGYAEYVAAREEFVLLLPASSKPVSMAPLLCAGLIGYRGLKLIEPAKFIGFYGFGSSAHLLIQLAVALGKKIFVFTRPGDTEKQEFARSLGAVWAGGTEEVPPELLDAALIFAPTGSLYPQALQAVKKGGRVVSMGIYMSDIPSFPYALLFGEKSLSCVSHLTRQDGVEFMQLLETIPVKAQITVFPLEQANEALALLKKGSFEGSIVLEIAKP